MVLQLLRKLLMGFFFSSPIRTKGIWAEKNANKFKKIRETSPQTPFIQLAVFIGKARVTPNAGQLEKHFVILHPLH